MSKGSICRNCFHSYVCEKFNENKDDNNEKCHFFNSHYAPTADVVPRSEVDALEHEIYRLKYILRSYALQYGTVMGQQKVIDEIKREGAREIFEEIERTCVDSFGCFYTGATHGAFAELKKKYMEGDSHEYL